MKKKFLMALVLVLALSLVLMACGENGTDEPDNGTTQKRIAMITNASINDGGWNQACYAGMVAAAETYEFGTQYTENVAEADYVSTIADYSNMGFDILFLPGNEYTDAVEEVAETHPDTSYILLNGLIFSDNIMSVKADNYEMGFAAGILAGLKTRTDSIGYISAMEITTSKENLSGYKQGAQHVNPDIEVSDAWTNSWTDSAKGKELALSMISTNDVDVFFGNAGQIDVGVREGAAEHDNRWGIAQPNESLDQAPDIILTSIITDNEALIGLAMEAYSDGTFGNRVIEGGFKDKVLTLGQFGEAAKEVENEFMQYFNRMVEGEIEIVRDVDR